MHKSCVPVIASLCATLLCLLPDAALSQTSSLPKPSRTVYKCNDGGNIVYSDDPCIGAQRIDIEPTRGMNKSTGKELTGSDVQREKHREIMSEGLKPLTGMSHPQMEVYRHRFNLTSADQSECANLDRSIAKTEADERLATTMTKADRREHLYVLRKRSRALRC